MPMPNKPRPGCERCGKPVKSLKNRFCSKSCRWYAMNETHDCKTCGKPYRFNPLSLKSPNYCSIACTPRDACPLCGEIIYGRRVNKSVNARRFCSRQCSIGFYAILNGKTNYRVKGFAATLVRTGKIACERCGFCRNLHALVVHHKDRDHANVSDDNLETLCANCHQVEHRAGSAKRAMDLRAARFIAGQIKR